METQIEAFVFSGVSFEEHGRQTLKFYGQSDKGAFLVIIDSFQNYFFVESKSPAPYKSLDGAFAQKVLVSGQTAMKAKKLEFESAGLKTYEADIGFVDRFLMDHRLYAQVNITGKATSKNGLLVFKNPSMTQGHYYPHFKIMSFDIETGRDGRLLSIAYSFKSREYSEDRAIVLGAKGEVGNVSFALDERGVLDFFQKAVQRLDPDILTGWNVVGFDLHFLDKKSKEQKFPLVLGRGERALNMRQNARGDWQAQIEGRTVIDGPRSLKMNFFSFESFKLGEVAKVLLGDTKDIDEDADYDKWDEIERRFREDKLALARYNIKDAVLVLSILEKTKLMELLLNRSIISGMLLDRVGGSVASFDHFYLPDLHQAKIVAKNVEDVSWTRQGKGGFVLDPEVGVHSHVLVMDFKSLYPTVIQTFLIDPLSRFDQSVDPLKTPVGFSFSRTRHILPGKIGELLQKRKEAKKAGNAQLSQAVKILMNSFYGVMGSMGCRFYHEDLSDAITGSGQWILKKTIEFLAEKKLRVLYGDTDSLFVQLPTGEDFDGQAKHLVAEVNLFLDEKLKKDFQVESKLEIQYDKFFKTLILTSTRGMKGGAKKRYAGLVVKEVDGVVQEEMVLTGMEYVRSDWSLLAKNFQYELVRRVFYREGLEEYILETLNKLERRELDEQLVLKKRLSKPLVEYVKNVPPHARAGKILFEKKGIVKKAPEYVMTKRGPIPIELPHDDIDIDYYVTKQLAPIAESILSLFGKSFEEMQGSQLSLF